MIPLSTLISARVRTCIATVTGHPVDVLAPECSLVENLGADALDLLEIGLALETEFGVDVSDDHLHQAGTVGELCALVDSLLAEKVT